ncbi:circadian clock KaiB family protein [Anaerolineales bacterium HSG24]|nr:circadian clock KaiB family protein [Anaerolineales bacterium HSG24]
MITTDSRYILRLFVAGDELNSRLARQNLEEICHTYLQQQSYEIKVFDILEDIQVAFDNGIIITPMLIASFGQIEVKIMGNLNDTDKVLTALNLNKKEHADD